MFFYNRKNQKGFSLIELLVVVGIVGVLLAVVNASFSGSRHTTTNKAIRAELKEIQLALEVYRAQNGEYPPAGDRGVADCKSTSGGIDVARESNCAPSQLYIAELAGSYTPSLLQSAGSRNSSCDYVYQVNTDGAGYKLTAERCLGGFSDETEGIQSADEMARCAATCSSGTCGGVAYDQTNPSFYESVAIYSPGSECW